MNELWEENDANMRRYNSVMHRAVLAPILAALAAAGLWAQKPPFDAQALLDLARIADPQVSPDGRLVAFTVQRIDVPNNKRITQIFVVPVAGGMATQITQGGDDNERPRWLPDAKRIACISECAGTSQAWVMNADGADSRQITSLATEAGGVLISADGKTL